MRRIPPYKKIGTPGSQLVGRNETALSPVPFNHLSRAHSDIHIIGGVRKPLQLHCEGREAYSVLKMYGLSRGAQLQHLALLIEG